MTNTVVFKCTKCGLVFAAVDTGNSFDECPDPTCCGRSELIRT